MLCISYLDLGSVNYRVPDGLCSLGIHAEESAVIWAWFLMAISLEHKRLG
jgi:hypothetical protein